MAGVALATGLALTALAVPRLWVGLSTLTARSVLWETRFGRDVDPAAWSEAAHSLEAGQLIGDGQMAADRGFLLLQAALYTTDQAERKKLLDQSLAATAGGLAESPVQPGAWARLSWLRERNGDVAGALEALRLSFLTGAMVPPLMSSRIELAMRLLPHMDGELRHMVDRQIRLLWVSDPDRLVAYAARPEWGQTIRAALAGLMDEETAQYIRLYGRNAAAGGLPRAGELAR